MKYSSSKWQAPKGWAALRQAVLTRDGWKCRACGAKVGKGGRKAHVHHMLGLKSNEIYDLVTLCGSCHHIISKLAQWGRRLLDDDSSWARIRSYALTYILAHPKKGKR